MKIEIIKSLEDAHQASDLAVVIDVFRAFSVEAYVFANGAAKIIPVLTLEEAYDLKKKNPEYILIGERGGLKPEGFDYGNSPTEVLSVDFSGKTIIHTTSNGTKGLANTINAKTVLVGSFVIASSIAKYINQNNFQDVSLISTSHHTEINNEDMLCAQYIQALLEGTSVDEKEIKVNLKNVPAHSFLLDEAGVPSTDIDLCLEFNKFDFVIKKATDSGHVCLVKESL